MKLVYAQNKWTRWLGIFSQRSLIDACDEIDIFAARWPHIRSFGRFRHWYYVGVIYEQSRCRIIQLSEEI